MKKPDISDYIGVTHFTLWDGWLPEWIYKFWKNIFCPRGVHMLDEVWSLENHYLYCDACGFEIDIKTREEELEEDGWCNKVDWP